MKVGVNLSTHSAAVAVKLSEPKFTCLIWIYGSFNVQRSTVRPLRKFYILYVFFYMHIAHFSISHDSMARHLSMRENTEAKQVGRRRRATCFPTSLEPGWRFLFLLLLTSLRSYFLILKLLMALSQIIPAVIRN
jgi:hypothetical protein